MDWLDKCWDVLWKEMKQKKGIQLLVGNFNGRLCNCTEISEGCVIKCGEDVKTSNGQTIINYCILNNDSNKFLVQTQSHSQDHTRST